MLITACLTWPLIGQQRERRSDEEAIRLLIRDRESAWNRGDVAAYSKLLTEDADLLSATGRSATTRRTILDLYVEQRAGAYKGGRTVTPVDSIRFVTPDVAIVDSHFQILGLHGSDGSALPIRRGLLTLLVVKQKGQWLITSMRGIPETPIGR